jgi:gliding motility-associated-like protein
MWCDVGDSDSTASVVLITITDSEHVTTVSIIPQGGTDTLYYQYPAISMTSDKGFEVNTQQLFPLGWYVVFLDGVPYTVFYSGCWEQPECGSHYQNPTNSSGFYEFVVNTDTIAVLRIDLQAYSITDSVEIFFGETSVGILGIGGQNAKAFQGPLVWENGVVRSYYDSLHTFPYFKDLGVSPIPSYGLGIVLLHIPDSVCDVRFRIWGNVNTATVWQAFVHCSPNVVKPSFSETVVVHLCDPGYVADVFVVRDTTWTRSYTSMYGCFIDTLYIVTMGIRPHITVSYDTVSCVDLPVRVVFASHNNNTPALKGFLSSADWDLPYELFLSAGVTSVTLTQLVHTGTHEITLTAEADGCIDEVTFELVRWDCTLYFPTAFSPNYDGINELFYPMTGSEGIEILELEIYDRWGNHVYKERNFPPNDPHYGWDGRFRGQVLDSGTYVWWSRVRFPDDRVALYKGEIVLIK